MSNAHKSGQNWGWMIAALLAFGAAFGASRLMGSKAPPAADTPSVVDTSPLSEEKRYKVPVSLSQAKRGAADALVTVVEWCDLHGAPCRETDAIMTSLQSEYGEKLRYVWRHFTTEAEPDVLRLHELAHTANVQSGKSWEVRARTLKHDKAPTQEELQTLIADVGLDAKAINTSLEKHSYAGPVGADMMFAQIFGVKAAPTLFVNGHRLLGKPTRERLKRLIDQELVHAQALVKNGVARETLYDEITKEGLWKVAEAP